MTKNGSGKRAKMVCLFTHQIISVNAKVIEQGLKQIHYIIYKIHHLLSKSSEMKKHKINYK